MCTLSCLVCSSHYDELGGVLTIGFEARVLFSERIGMKQNVQLGKHSHPLLLCHQWH